MNDKTALIVFSISISIVLGIIGISPSTVVGYDASFVGLCIINLNLIVGAIALKITESDK